MMIDGKMIQAKYLNGAIIWQINQAVSEWFGSDGWFGSEAW